MKGIKEQAAACRMEILVQTLKQEELPRSRPYRRDVDGKSNA